jgi:thymidylate kinase
MLKINSSRKKRLPMIALIGADGSGKSSVLDFLSENFKHDLVREIYILYDIHNLKFMDKKPEPGKPILNYEKSPHSNLYSFVKLNIMVFLWVLKFYFKIAPMKRSGTLVLCDHFYFLGMALDPLKYRYGGNLFWIKLLLGMVPQPDMYILLDVPLDIVYGRRQEATRDEVNQLLERHREYISSNPCGYVVNAANPVEQVAADVSRIIVQEIE